MEKTLLLKHGNFEAVIAVPKRFSIPDDYDEEILKILSKDDTQAWRGWRTSKLKEYRSLGFPVWKRSNLISLQLPDPTLKPQILTQITCLWEPIYRNDEALNILKEWDFEGSDRKFVLQSDVFFNEGLFIHAHDGRKEEAIVEVRGDGAAILNNMVKLDDGAELTLIWFVENTSYLSFLTRYIVGKNAVLHVLYVRAGGETLFSNEYFLLKEGAKVRILEVDRPEKLSAPFVLVSYTGKNSEATLKHAYSLKATQKSDSMFVLRHNVPGTRGLLESVGVLHDKARAVFRGNIEIKQRAVDTETSEKATAVLLSESARADAIPALMVEENEVAASHAATIGTVGEDELYYLMSRGLSKELALKLIVEGIFEPIVKEAGELFGEHWQEVITRVLTRKHT